MFTVPHDRLEQLAMQRECYELARRSTVDPAVAARHAATIARLDEEIEAQRRMLATNDPSVSLPSRPCIEAQGSACDLSGRYDKVRGGSVTGRFAAVRARVPAPVWLALFVALVAGIAFSSLGLILEPSLARAASTAPTPNE